MKEVKSKPDDRLTDFERAICYYTLPAMDTRITTGLVLVFALILLEALGALAYGLHAENRTYTIVGTWSLGVMIVFGIVVFTMRALLNDIRRRRTLAVARAMPEPDDVDQSVPNPFVRHELFRLPEGGATPIMCTDNDGAVRYTIDKNLPGGWISVKNSEGIEHLRINVRKSNSSFSLSEDNTPSQADVFIGAERVGVIHRDFNFREPVFTVANLWPEQRTYILRDNGIYRERRMTGRIYRLRRYVYLDVHEDDYCEAILAFFVIHAS